MLGGILRADQYHTTNVSQDVIGTSKMCLIVGVRARVVLRVGTLRCFVLTI